MNQVFRINVGPETVLGRLPPARVGVGFSCRFHIAGVDHVADVPPPKIWVTRDDDDTLYWEAVWDNSIGLWVATIGNTASASAGSYIYALTMYGEDVGAEFIAGQGVFTAYTSIAYVGESGASGTSIGGSIIALDARLTAIEDKLAELATVSTFDAAHAYDYEMRQQIEAITNILRGNQA